MAEGKVDLKEDLGLAKPADEPWPAKDDAYRGNDEVKVLMGFLDESKDQAASENNIPLSPQWLYAKPVESKVGLSAASGETRLPNSLPQGTSLDSIQKDAWRLDGSQNKKEWRRNVPDVESNRRWREEERETGLLGRRERRKEGDRENEYRKNDRRSDNIPTRETSDSWTLQSSDRWNDATGRNSGHESRRDSKWSTRWGPEDKSKDSRVEKKMDVDKEDAYPEKQSIVGSNRHLSESDSRDKWRPRHRQEVHCGGSAVYRAAPGFGAERGRVEGSNAGFAPGRGRSNFIGGVPSSSFSSAGPIGAAPTIRSESFHGKSSFNTDTFRYPRGKLLDIYRKHRMFSPFDASPDGLEEVPPITQPSSITPMAFVKPDPEEEAVLEDIWKGKIASREVCHDSSGERISKINNHVIDSDFGECKDKVNALSNGMDPAGMTSPVSNDDACYNIIMPDSLTHSKQSVGEVVGENDDRRQGPIDFPKDAKFGEVSSSASFDVSTKLPDDSNSLFDTSFIQEIPGNDIQHQSSYSGVEKVEQGTFGELSLFYMDPQGNIQGPFLAEDIISWYDDGYFGSDLPVCLSDAPEGIPFRPLGEIFPQLSLRPQFSLLINSGEQSESSDTFRGNLEADASASEFSSSLAINGPQWASSGSAGPFNHQVHPGISECEDSIDSHIEKLAVPILEGSPGIPGAEGQSFHDLSGQDAEEVLYMGRPASKIQNSLGKLADDLHDPSRTTSGPQFLTGEMGQANSADHRVPTENDLNPLGLSWSELEVPHQKGPLSANIPGVGDQGCIIDSLLGGDASFFRKKHEQFGLENDPSILRDAWPSSYIRNTSSDVLQDAMRVNHNLSQFEPEPTPFNVEEHLMSQQFQKQQLQQQLLLSHFQNMHLNGSFLEQLQGSMNHQQSINQSMPDMEHLLKLQFHQQRHFQHLEQQQQLHHQMQLLQQQRQQQQHQLLLEQFLHQQLHDPSIGALRADPLLGGNTLDLVLHRQRLLHELQQQTHHLARNHDPSIDQLIQTKFHHKHHSELIDALSHSSQRHMLPLEQQLLLGLQAEQLQAQQFAIASRQQLGNEEERQVGGVWSVDESGRYIRGAARPHQDPSSRLSQLDFIQPLQRPSSFEQPSHLERNFVLHDRMQGGNYETSSQPFGRSASTPGPNVDLVNAFARLQEMDLHEHHGQMGQYPSSSHSSQPWLSEQLSASQLDPMERSWSESNAQLRNNLRESEFIQLHLAAEKQKREMKGDLSVGDPNRWASLVGNDENSNHEVADLLQQKMALQSSQSFELVDGASTSSFENRDPSWLFTRPATDHLFNLAADKLGSVNSFTEGSLLTNLGQTTQERPVNVNCDEQANAFEITRRLAFQSSSGALVEHKQLFSDIGEIKEQFADATSGDISRTRINFSDVKEGNMVLKRGYKGIAMSRSISNTLDGGVEQAGASLIDLGDLKANGPVRYDSFGSTGGVTLYNYEMGADNAYVDEMVNDRISRIFSKGSDVSLLSRTHGPHILSSQGALSELVPGTTPMKGKNPVSLAYSEEGRRDPGGNPGVRVLETPSSSKKDMLSRRTSSYSDADAPEASFIDMLKSTKKPALETDASSGAAESLDAGGSGGRGSKKKGKKGRQIDPSLLGFKVHSNRILMGEIQRPDD